MLKSRLLLFLFLTMPLFLLNLERMRAQSPTPASTEAAATGIGQVTSAANLRSTASTGSQIIRSLAAGTDVQVLEELDGEAVTSGSYSSSLWYRVRIDTSTGSVDGYVWSGLLRISSNGDAPIPTATPETIPDGFRLVDGLLIPNDSEAFIANGKLYTKDQYPETRFNAGYDISFVFPDLPILKMVGDRLSGVPPFSVLLTNPEATRSFLQQYLKFYINLQAQDVRMGTHRLSSISPADLGKLKGNKQYSVQEIINAFKNHTEIGYSIVDTPIKTYIELDKKRQLPVAFRTTSHLNLTDIRTISFETIRYSLLGPQWNFGVPNINGGIGQFQHWDSDSGTLHIYSIIAPGTNHNLTEDFYAQPRLYPTIMVYESVQNLMPENERDSNASYDTTAQINRDYPDFYFTLWDVYHAWVGIEISKDLKTVKLSPDAPVIATWW